MADSPEEKAHWKDILRAFDGYMQYHLSANHGRRLAFLSLPDNQKQLYDAIGYREKLEAVDEGIRRNSEFIDMMIQDPVFADMLAGDDEDSAAHSHHHHSHDHGPSHGHDFHTHDGHSHDHSQAHVNAGTPPDHHQHPPDSHGADDEGDEHTAAPSPSNPKPQPSQSSRDNQQDKVRSTLRSFVRDWSKEGAPERDACYRPLLEALEAHFPDPASRTNKKVLVPGCGLGRLAMDVAARGFWSQGNEFSTYMLIASHFALNQTSTAEEHILFPYLHSWSNHLSTGQHLLRSVRVPDVVPADILAGIAPGNFSLVAGDFEEIYGPTHWFTPRPGEEADADDEDSGRVNQRGRWSAVVTCFFIDTARSVLNYMRIIHGLLEDGGVWINVGPLLWHFENSAPRNGIGSIELSLDEVKELAGMVGFDIQDERMIRSSYTGIPDSMLEHIYNCAFWVATKKP